MYSLLHYASSCGDIDIFSFVLDQCERLEETLLVANNDTDETPLHFAVSCNNIDIARILIEKMKEIKS